MRSATHVISASLVLCLAQIEDDLRTYDAPASGPHHHIWYFRDDRWEGDVFFNAPSPGMDTLQIFKVRSHTGVHISSHTLVFFLSLRAQTPMFCFLFCLRREWFD